MRAAVSLDELRPVRRGLRMAVDNLGLSVGVAVVVIVAAAAPETVKGLIIDPEAAWQVRIPLSYGLWIAGVLISSAAVLGASHALLRLYRGEDVTTLDAFDVIDHPARIVAFSVLSLVTTPLLLLGLMLGVVPGLYLMVLLTFSTLLIADKGADALQSARGSAALTDGHRWEVFWLLARLGALNLLGALPVGLGLLVTLPASLLAITCAYEHLCAQQAPTGGFVPPPVPPGPRGEGALSLGGDQPSPEEAPTGGFVPPPVPPAPGDDHPPPEEAPTGGFVPPPVPQKPGDDQ